MSFTSCYPSSARLSSIDVVLMTNFDITETLFSYLVRSIQICTKGCRLTAMEWPDKSLKRTI